MIFLAGKKRQPETTGNGGAMVVMARSPLRKLLHVLIFISLFSYLVTGVKAPSYMSAKPASACTDICICEFVFAAILAIQIVIEHELMRAWIRNEFEEHRDHFWMNFLWRDHILLALQMMMEQLTSTGTQQLFAIGAFLDAKQQMETQRLLQDKMAEAHLNYHPDVGMCTIGTAARGLASASRNGEMVAFTLSQRQHDRSFNNRNSSATFGESADKMARLEQFKRRYCDINDNNQGMEQLCGTGPTPRDHVNKDIDFTRMVLTPLTINVDYSDTARNGDDEDIFALSSNLFGHVVFSYFPEARFNDATVRSFILDRRAVAAKRSVARHSFESIVGMKSAGTAISANTAPYLRVVLRQLGLDDANAGRLIGDRPSYYAQMELLTKKIYQNPQFYVNLYEAPAAVERKAAALQAIRLMQDMDKFKSTLRSESIMSVLLEMHIDEQQQEVRNEINALTTSTTR